MQMPNLIVANSISFKMSYYKQTQSLTDAERGGGYLLASSTLLHHITKIKNVGCKAPYETKQSNYSIYSTQKKMKNHSICGLIQEYSIFLLVKEYQTPYIG